MMIEWKVVMCSILNLSAPFRTVHTPFTQQKAPASVKKSASGKKAKPTKLTPEECADPEELGVSISLESGSDMNYFVLVPFDGSMDFSNGKKEPIRRSSFASLV